MRRHSPLLLILLLLGSLAVSQAAAAATTLPQLPTTSVLLPQGPTAEPEEELEGEEGFEIEEEFEIEECEATAQGVEFGEMEEAEEEEIEEEVEACEEEAEKGKSKTKGKGESFVSAPAACLVQRAESTITTLPGSDRVRLTVHYKNYSSAPIAIDLKLKDHKGSLGLEHTTKHFGHAGVLHLTTRLGEAEMERVADAREFDVALRASGTPGYCSDLLEQHLHSPHAPAQAHGSRVYGKPTAA
jgi:hypothetical protein